MCVFSICKFYILGKKIFFLLLNSYCNLFLEKILRSVHNIKYKMGDSKICDISDEVLSELQKFRFRKNSSNSALILKVDREKQAVVLDELIDDVTVEDLQEILPGHQPRYVIYTYKMIHDDQRISYPMCFIFYTPRDSQIELQMMYACTKSAVQREFNLRRVFEIRELDELTEEWLKKKLK